MCVCSQPVDRNVTGLLRTTRVHDRLTPRMVAAFFHTNFSLTQERSTDVSLHAAVLFMTRYLRRASAAGRRAQMQHHLDDLPDRLPGDDEMQQTLGKWIAEGMAAKRQWEVDDRLAKEQAQRDEQFAQLEDNKAKFLQVCICGCVTACLWPCLCLCLRMCLCLCLCLWPWLCLWPQLWPRLWLCGCGCVTVWLCGCSCVVVAVCS